MLSCALNHEHTAHGSTDSSASLSVTVSGSEQTPWMRQKASNWREPKNEARCKRWGQAKKKGRQQKENRVGESRQLSKRLKHPLSTLDRAHEWKPGTHETCLRPLNRPPSTLYALHLTHPPHTSKAGKLGMREICLSPEPLWYTLPPGNTSSHAAMASLWVRASSTIWHWKKKHCCRTGNPAVQLWSFLQKQTREADRVEVWTRQVFNCAAMQLELLGCRHSQRNLRQQHPLGKTHPSLKPWHPSWSHPISMHSNALYTLRHKGRGIGVTPFQCTLHIKAQRHSKVH
eukprot:1152842-Pelagomonas_calceolata.AAC.8